MFSPSLSQSVHRIRCWQPRDSLSKVLCRQLMSVYVWHSACVYVRARTCTFIPLNLSGQLISSSHVKRAPGGTLLLREWQGHRWHCLNAQYGTGCGKLTNRIYVCIHVHHSLPHSPTQGLHTSTLLCKTPLQSYHLRKLGEKSSSRRCPDTEVMVIWHGWEHGGGAHTKYRQNTKNWVCEHEKWIDTYPSKKVVRKLVDLVEFGESFSLHEQESNRRNAQVRQQSPWNDQSYIWHTLDRLIT